MWLLHARHDHGGARPLEPGAQPQPRRDRPRHERQRLPLRRLLAHPDGRREGGEADAGGRPMNEHLFLDEPERYELHDGDGALQFDRREFFRIVGGRVIAASLLSNSAVQAQRGGRGGGSQPRELGAWLHVAEDSAVTVYTGKVEVGQNIRTSLTQVVAEELRLPVGRISLVMADTARTP